MDIDELFEELSEKTPEKEKVDEKENEKTRTESEIEEIDVIEGNEEEILKEIDEAIQEETGDTEDIDDMVEKLKSAVSESELSDEGEIETSTGLVIKKEAADDYDKIVDAQLNDMEQVIAMSMGNLSSKVLDEYVYDIDGKPVLSFAGILKVVRIVGNIKVELQRLERTPRRCVYKATATDLSKNISVDAIGVVDLDVIERQVERLKKEAEQGYRSKYRNYEVKLIRAEEFMEELASSFARRNALRCLIDEREWAYKISKMLVKKKSAF